MNPEKLQLTGGGKKENRRELDFYPTPPEVTIALMEFLKSIGYPLPHSCWEPACGDGAMVNVLKKYIPQVDGTDIKNGYDYLKLHYTRYQSIITNPPFNLSEQFIKKALNEAPLVAMLLKSQYWHAKKRYELFMQHKPACILPLTWRPDFKGENGSPTMEVYWTVWIKDNTDCKYLPLLKPTTTNNYIEMTDIFSIKIKDIPKNVKCNCGHTFEYHWNGGWCHSDISSQCRCSYFDPNP